MVSRTNLPVVVLFEVLMEKLREVFAELPPQFTNRVGGGFQVIAVTKADFRVRPIQRGIVLEARSEPIEELRRLPEGSFQCFIMQWAGPRGP